MWAEHRARILSQPQNWCGQRMRMKMLDALVGALFPYTFFGGACRHLFGHYLPAR
jgi:hypothetical protein